MLITVFMVASYMGLCTLLLTKPCKYFQLNARHFDAKEGIFSKIYLDSLIPLRWRLKQGYIDTFTPETYPVFIKPEWGQNANGIAIAESQQQLIEYRSSLNNTHCRFIVQEAVKGREFEIFAIAHHKDKTRYAVLTVTESCNEQDALPINSVNNKHTYYQEITDTFSLNERASLWQFMRQIGDFNIARLSVKSESVESLLAGDFKTIEINIFIPMPINLLDRSHSVPHRIKLIFSYMYRLALATRYRDKTQQEKPVFTKIMLYNRQHKWLRALHAKI